MVVNTETDLTKLGLYQPTLIMLFSTHEHLSILQKKSHTEPFLLFYHHSTLYLKTMYSAMQLVDLP